MSNVLLPMDTRRQLLRALKTRYQAASKAEKTRILEEFILKISNPATEWCRYQRKPTASICRGSLGLWRSCSAGSDRVLGSFRSVVR